MMLKIMHTADWHVGQALAGYSRMAEHRAALAELVRIAVEERIDALVLAGDVFDTQSPKAEAETLVYETLSSLSRALPKATLVIVAGNHDLAGRIEAPSPLYRAFGIHAIGGVRRQPDGIDLDHHLIPLPDASGTVRAYCLALPYPRTVDLPGLELSREDDGSPIVREVRRLYGEAVAAARVRIGDIPLLATGHLHVLGATESEGAERAILVGGQHAAPADIFGVELAYVALGHLHRPQTVGRPTIRYSGSLFPLSATERNYDHGVSLVTLAEGRIDVRHRAISRPAPFLRIPDKGAIAPEEAEAALAALALDPAVPEGLRPLVQFSLRLTGPQPGLEADLDRLARAYPIRLIGHVVEGAPDDSAALAAIAAIHQPLAERRPVDLFVAAFEKKHGSAPDADHFAVFEAALVAAGGG